MKNNERNDKAKKKAHKKKQKTGKRAAWTSVPGPERWEAWAGYLQTRSPADRCAKSAGRGVAPLKWALPDSYEELPTPRLLRQITQLGVSSEADASLLPAGLETWLKSAADAPPTDLFALECIAWCHSLSRLARMIPRQLWLGLLAQLEEIAESASGLQIQDEPVVHQLLAGELPLSLAYLLPGIPRFRKLGKQASRALSYGAVEILDGEGLPNARHFPVARQLLACWTRCSIIGGVKGADCFDGDARIQYEWMVQQMLRLSRSDGTLVLSRGLSGDWCPDLMEAALAESRDRADREIARHALPGKPTKITNREARKLPSPSVYSEWAEACVMRAKWARKSPQLTCLFDERQFRSELVASGRVVWSGDVQTTLGVDKKVLEAESDWRELCWFTDEDVDYLELEQDYAKGWTIQRQVLLSRSDHFLFLADAVAGPGSANIDYRTILPLADDICFEQENETRDGFLANDRPLTTILPLALPEWQAAHSQGSLESKGRQLHHTLSAVALRLYAPLWVDLQPRRLREKRTWRQLTVAEQLVAQPVDVAAGFRVQLGRSQWLIYRSLAPRSNRTVFGQNLSKEFVLARFDLDGSLFELIEIE